MAAWLLSCAIKAALLLAASWLGAALLRRSSAAARHQIWTLGVIGALLLPALSRLLPSLSTHTSTIASTHSLDAFAVFVTAAPATHATAAWPSWLAIGWALGAVVVALQSIRGHLAARRLVRSAAADIAESWTAALRDAAPNKRVELLRSETIGSPMTIGVLRPRVLLPAVAETWSPERLRAVLVHELGHVHRHDTVIQLAAQLACALYWWNPLAWLAAARLRIEREHACDDLVLDAGIRPSSYAADLLAVARSIAADGHATICMVDRSGTETRLHRILDAATPRGPVSARFRVATVGLACAVTLACTSPTKVTPAPLGTLSVGAPFVRDDWDMAHPPVNHGDVDLSAVAIEVDHRLGNLEHCYERRLAVKPALSGTVVLHWTIAETGKVADQCITKDTLDDDEVTACVNQLVKEGDFPASRDGSVDVSFPFVFTARPAT